MRDSDLHNVADVERAAPAEKPEIEKVDMEKGELPPLSPESDYHAPIYDVAILNTDYDGKPTEEEMATLRRVPGKLPTVAFLLCAVEFCERASYYGRFQAL